MSISHFEETSKKVLDGFHAKIMSTFSELILTSIDEMKHNLKDELELKFVEIDSNLSEVISPLDHLETLVNDFISKTDDSRQDICSEI